MPTFTTQGVALHAWPHQFKPSEITLHLRFNTTTFTSPYSGSTQTSELPGALHQLEAGFPPVAPPKVGDLRAFFAGLRGGAGRFIFPALPCRYAPPAQYASERTTLLPFTADNARVTVDTTRITADATQIQMETVFTVSSCPNASTIIGTLWLNSRIAPLEVGSPISWDDASGWRHLHVVTSLITSGANTTLTVEPPVRELPTPATPMHVHAPSGVFRLVDDGQGALRQAGRLSSFSISAVQAYPVKIGVPA